MTTRKKDVIVTTRIPANLQELIDDFIERDTHLNRSDLVRDAIREKVKKDAPELYAELFKKVKFNVK
jgi:metal-responsive CopG/Arc/MetJ family transcriptional regulator